LLVEAAIHARNSLVSASGGTRYRSEIDKLDRALAEWSIGPCAKCGRSTYYTDMVHVRKRVRQTQSVQAGEAVIHHPTSAESREYVCATCLRDYATRGELLIDVDLPADTEDPNA
jgi:hypothetical protein